MTTTTTTPSPAAPSEEDPPYGTLVDAADLDAEELPDDEREDIEWLTTGGMRCRIRGEWHRLRRPNIGELRQLHEALEEQRDQSALFIQQLKVETQQLGREIQRIGAEMGEALKDLADAGEVDPDGSLEARVFELTGQMADVSRRQSRASASSTLKQWEMGEAWWGQVFKLLRPKGQAVPKVLPSWVGDMNLPGDALNHWMRVPLGRGGRRPGQ